MSFLIGSVDRTAVLRSKKVQGAREAKAMGVAAAKAKDYETRHIEK